jgi:pSer/pThr/pTyr-binding forkhead associated (FHA) protein
VAFRLRYQQHDLELTAGTFAIGRSAACQLSVDDPLVSRRHALFTVAADTVEVEDLGSRNGVSVNGKKVEGRVRVLPGDKIVIGAQELGLILVAEDEAGPPPTNARVTRQFMATISQPAGDAWAEDAETTRIARPNLDAVDESSVVKRMAGLRVLGSIAEKALAMGRAEEAERVLAAPLADVLDATRKTRATPPAIAEQATRFAAKLATATGKGAWVDYAVEIYTALQRPAPAAVVDELYAACRKVTNVDIAKVKAYVEVLRELLPTLGPADRFLFQRIEGLERLVTLRS